MAATSVTATPTLTLQLDEPTAPVDSPGPTAHPASTATPPPDAPSPAHATSPAAGLSAATTDVAAAATPNHPEFSLAQLTEVAKLVRSIDSGITSGPVSETEESAVTELAQAGPEGQDEEAETGT